MGCRLLYLCKLFLVGFVLVSVTVSLVLLGVVNQNDGPHFALLPTSVSCLNLVS